MGSRRSCWESPQSWAGGQRARDRPTPRGVSGTAVNVLMARTKRTEEGLRTCRAGDQARKLAIWEDADDKCRFAPQRVPECKPVINVELPLLTGKPRRSACNAVGGQRGNDGHKQRAWISGEGSGSVAPRVRGLESGGGKEGEQSQKVEWVRPPHVTGRLE